MMALLGRDTNFNVVVGTKNLASRNQFTVYEVEPAIHYIDNYQPHLKPSVDDIGILTVSLQT